jgi:hypothetical protein
MSATYVTSHAITPDTLVETYQALADMFSTLSSIAFQSEINVLIKALDVSVDGFVTVVTQDPIPDSVNPPANLGLVRTA